MNCKLETRPHTRQWMTSARQSRDLAQCQATWLDDLDYAVIVYFCILTDWSVMAQALVDLTYYKCGHCQQNFNSLAAFGKHQKDRHTPKNAPKSQPKAEDLAETGKLAHHTVDFALKVKLCQKCVGGVKLERNKQILEVPLCPGCQQKNGYSP